MLWESLALTCVGSALDALFGGSKGISEADFRSALADAVDEIKQDIRFAILDARLNELTGRIFGVQTLLREYVQTSDRALLDETTSLSATICGELMYLQHPTFPVLVGLPGHTLFMVAAGLRTQILQKRIELIGAAEKQPLQVHLDTSISHAELMHLMWESYNWARFVGPFAVPEVGPVPRVRFWYQFDGQAKQTPFTADMNPFTDDYDRAEQHAAEFIESERDKKWQEVQTNVITPSEQVVARWDGLRTHKLVPLPAIKDKVIARLLRITGLGPAQTSAPQMPPAPTPKRPVHT